MLLQFLWHNLYLQILQLTSKLLLIFLSILNTSSFCFSACFSSSSLSACSFSNWRCRGSLACSSLSRSSASSLWILIFNLRFLWRSLISSSWWSCSATRADSTFVWAACLPRPRLSSVTDISCFSATKAFHSFSTWGQRWLLGNKLSHVKLCEDTCKDPCLSGLNV